LIVRGFWSGTARASLLFLALVLILIMLFIAPISSRESVSVCDVFLRVSSRQHVVPCFHHVLYNFITCLSDFWSWFGLSKFWRQI